jgi:hypothetical protein
MSALKSVPDLGGKGQLPRASTSKGGTRIERGHPHRKRVPTQEVNELFLVNLVVHHIGWLRNMRASTMISAPGLHKPKSGAACNCYQQNTYPTILV